MQRAKVFIILSFDVHYSRKGFSFRPLTAVGFSVVRDMKCMLSLHFTAWIKTKVLYREFTLIKKKLRNLLLCVFPGPPTKSAALVWVANRGEMKKLLRAGNLFGCGPWLEVKTIIHVHSYSLSTEILFQNL
jgi:hypothetical protein